MQGRVHSVNACLDRKATPPYASQRQTASQKPFGNFCVNTLKWSRRLARIKISRHHLRSGIWGRKNSNRLREIHEYSAGILELDEPGHEGDTIAGRLKILDRRIHRAIQSLFQWHSWEVRLLHPETKQLELFVSHNLAPLRIGESIFAAAKGNGITGRVAATGQCVLTRQADSDDDYLPGLEGAQSTMTLPLQLGTRILGTLNVESQKRAAFSEADLSEALLLGRYIAAASTSSSWFFVGSAVDRQTAVAFERPAHPIEKLEAVGESNLK